MTDPRMAAVDSATVVNGAHFDAILTSPEQEIREQSDRLRIFHLSIEFDLLGVTLGDRPRSTRGKVRDKPLLVDLWERTGEAGRWHRAAYRHETGDVV